MRKTVQRVDDAEAVPAVWGIHRVWISEVPATYGIIEKGFRMGGNEGLKEVLARAGERRRRMVVHRAAGFEDAEAWDLEYWQSRTPEERLEAYMALRRDVELVLEARERDLGTHPEKGGPS